MSKSIPISPKYGVNPTIPVCFYCGKDKNEIALLGRITEKDPRTGRAIRGSDLEAPMRMILDYEPCDECKANFALGVALIGVSTEAPDNRQPVPSSDGTEVYPTGSYAVMKPEAVTRVFGGEYKNGDRLYIQDELLKQLTGSAPED